MIGADVLDVVVIVVMQDSLPLILKLAVAAFQIRDGRGQRERRDAGRRIERAIGGAADRDVWRRVVQRDVQRRTRGQTAGVRDRQCHNIVRANVAGRSEHMRRIRRRAHRRAVAEIPGVGDGLPIRIARTAAVELIRQRTGAVGLAGRDHGDGRAVPGVSELPDRAGVAVVEDVVKTAVERMLHDGNHGAYAGGEGAHRRGLVVRVEREKFDDLLAPVGVKIFIRVGRRKNIAVIPRARHGTVALKLRAGNRRAGSAHISEGGVAGRVIRRRMGDGAGMFPVERRAVLEKLRDVGGNFYAGVARIVERRLPGGIGAGGLEQLAEGKILAAPTARIQRIRRVAIRHVGVVTGGSPIGRETQPLIQRPAKILARLCHHLQRLLRVPAHVADVERARIAVRRIVAAGIGAQRRPKRITKPERPDARFRGARIRWIVVGVARQAVARGGIKPQHFAAQAIHQLRTIRAHIFLYAEDSVVGRLRREAAARC